MAARPLVIYLNDHLAGAVIALQILESLETRKPGLPVERMVAELKVEVADDRRELEALMGRLKVSESRTRKTAAWFTEKLSELKALVDDPTGDLYLLEALDTISMGMEGKALLWKALQAASVGTPALRGPDYDLLTERAATQRRMVEKVRLTAARTALGGSA